MTNCSEIREHLPVHADGELTADLRATADAHLTACQSCRDQFERWRTLRRCARRVVATEALPDNLERQVRARLRRPVVRGRQLPLFAIGLAAAAVVVFVVAFYWPRDAAGPHTSGDTMAVTAEELAAVYLKCAVEHRHDADTCRDLAPDAAAKLLARKVGFEPLVPDLAAEGYFLDGACQCLRLSGAKAIHVYYRSEISADQVVSLFSVDRPVKLEAEDACNAASPCGSKRVYETGRVQNISVAKWVERGNTFALCAQMDRDALLQLADSPSLAKYAHELPAFARLDGR